MMVAGADDHKRTSVINENVLMHFMLYRPTQIVNYRAIVIALNHPWADIKIFIHNSVKKLCVYT